MTLETLAQDFYDAAKRAVAQSGADPSDEAVATVMLHQLDAITNSDTLTRALCRSLAETASRNGFSVFQVRNSLNDALGKAWEDMVEAQPKTFSFSEGLH